jgi:ubiquinone biosynthesis protein UbiJ
MLHTLHSLLAPAVLERLTLVINHVLGGEPVATERLRPHAGRRIELQLTAWPSLLPPPPQLAWRVTPAGLLEWQGLQPEPGAELQVRLDAANPAALAARMLAGEPPPLQVEGDAQFAGDINWLTLNLRWDVAADLERLFGPVVAQQLHTAGRGLAAALRAAVRAAQGLGERLRPRAPE